MNEYKRLTYWQNDKDDDGNDVRYACADGTKYALCDVLNRLAELEDKIENGTLVELPCKVGDTVHIIGEYRGLYEAKVRVFFVNENSVEMIRTTKCDIPIEELGKTLFLTKEEAEKALAERNIE